MFIQRLHLDHLHLLTLRTMNQFQSWNAVHCHQIILGYVKVVLGIVIVLLNTAALEEAAGEGEVSLHVDDKGNCGK